MPDFNDPSGNPFAPTPGDPRGMIPVIQAAALKYGIDPNIALRVARSEGLGEFSGDAGKSFGALQLYTGGGVGNEFQRDTGLDPSDPKNEPATIDYALRRAAQVGWGPWHGAAHVGIGEWEGIGGGQYSSGIHQLASGGGTDWDGLLKNSLSALGQPGAEGRPVINVNMGGDAASPGGPWNQLMQMSMVKQLMASGTHTVAPVEYDPWKGVTPAPAASPPRLLPARYVPVNHDPFMETMV